jgi:hypothetical protein
MTTWLGEEYSRLLRAGQPVAGFNSRPDLLMNSSGSWCPLLSKTLELLKMSQKPEDSVASFLGVFGGQKFAIVDYTHYLNRRGWRCSDKEAETILSQRKDLLTQIEPGVFARAQ